MPDVREGLRDDKENAILKIKNNLQPGKLREKNGKKEMKPITGTDVYKGQLSLQTWTNFILKDHAKDKWSKVIRLETGNGISTL